MTNNTLIRYKGIEREMTRGKLKNGVNILIIMQKDGPTETKTCTNLLANQKETMKRITKPNCDQSSFEGPQMNPWVGMKS